MQTTPNNPETQISRAFHIEIDGEKYFGLNYMKSWDRNAYDRFVTRGMAELIIKRKGLENTTIVETVLHWNNDGTLAYADVF